MLTLPMTPPDPHKLMKELFEALMDKNRSKVIELYKTNIQVDGNNFIKPYHLEVKYPKEYPLTTSHDTVLHIAMYTGQTELVKDLLLNIFSTDESDILLLKVNDLRDTILHEATTNMKIDSDIIDLMLRKKPELLTMRNNNDESPLFRAVHFGNWKMFEDLANRVDPHPEVHWRRNDGVTILHIAILNEHYELALHIAKRYPDLLGLRDQAGMTGLRLLSSMPLVFKSGCKHGWLMRLIYFCAPTPNSNSNSNSDDGQNKKTNNVVVQCYRTIVLGLRRINRLCWDRILRGWLLMDDVWKEKERHESAFRLVKYLIKHDYSWQERNTGGLDPERIVISSDYLDKPNYSHTYSHTRNQNWAAQYTDLMDASAFENSSDESKNQDPNPLISNDNEEIQGANKHRLETPLLVATSNGIEEIVEEILKLFPQAIEHVSYTGQNILHVAVMNRQKKIFDIVKKKEIPMKRLARRIDEKGNTVLHQVGNFEMYRGQRPGPALQLQEELIWFKLVKDELPSPFRMHLNAKGLNALDFFQENHKNLLQQAQDWLKRTSQSCSVVAVLIATVAFAAAYTVPGGNNDSGPQTGLPILINEEFFLVFTVMDVVSLASSLTSVVMFLSILTSPFQFQDFKRSLPRKLTLGFTFLFMAVATMMLAFAATIILTIKSEKNVSKLLIYTVAFLPVSIFALLQFPLYMALASTAQYSLLMLKRALPSCCIPSCLKAKNSKKKQ